MDNKKETPQEFLARKLAEARKAKELKAKAKNEITLDFSAEDEKLQGLKNIGIPPIENQPTTEATSNSNPFPVKVFPKVIQDIIYKLNRYLNFPIDFIGASILVACSTAIGHSCKAIVKKGWIESALLYTALVGRPGTGKSHPLYFAFNPIRKRDIELYKKYLSDMAIYRDLDKDEKKESEKPICRKTILSDATIEALITAHYENPRGVVVINDELAGWIKSFNRYTKGKGNEQEIWLSNWSGGEIRVDRKNSEPILIEHSYVPVCGTIQPSVLKKLGKYDLSENGFIDRILFVIPDNLKREYLSEDELPSSVIENWDKILSKLLDIPFNFIGDKYKSSYLFFSAEGYKAWIQWNKQNTDLCNNEENDILTSVFSKLDMYSVRLALILQVLFWVCDNESNTEISLKSIQGATQLVEYFRNNAIKANAIISNSSEGLSALKRNIYNALPDEFATKDGLVISRGFGMPEKTFKNFLADKSLFEKIRHGCYTKKY